MALRRPRSWGVAPSSARQPGIATPFAFGGKVVAKTSVGFGAPETVTVGTDESVVADEFEDEPIVNLGDEPYMMPEVELRKRRK